MITERNARLIRALRGLFGAQRFTPGDVCDAIARANRRKEKDPVKLELYAALRAIWPRQTLEGRKIGRWLRDHRELCDGALILVGEYSGGWHYEVSSDDDFPTAPTAEELLEDIARLGRDQNERAMLELERATTPEALEKVRRRSERVNAPLTRAINKLLERDERRQEREAQKQAPPGTFGGGHDRGPRTIFPEPVAPDNSPPAALPQPIPRTVERLPSWERRGEPMPERIRHAQMTSTQLPQLRNAIFVGGSWDPRSI